MYWYMSHVLERILDNLKSVKKKMYSLLPGAGAASGLKISRSRSRPVLGRHTAAYSICFRSYFLLIEGA